MSGDGPARGPSQAATSAARPDGPTSAGRASADQPGLDPLSALAEIQLVMMDRGTGMTLEEIQTVFARSLAYANLTAL